jgi:hypothetical protein
VRRSNYRITVFSAALSDARETKSVCGGRSRSPQLFDFDLRDSRRWLFVNCRVEGDNADGEHRRGCFGVWEHENDCLRLIVRIIHHLRLFNIVRGEGFQMGSGLIQLDFVVQFFIESSLEGFQVG